MKSKIDESKLIELFNQEIQIKDIAQYFNCDRNTITRKLQKLGLKQGNSYKFPKIKEDPLKDKKEKIKELYLSGKTCKEIGEIVNLAEKTVSYHLKRMNIKTRSKKKIDQEKFEELWSQNKSDKEIADYFGVEEITIKSFRTRGKNAGKFKRTDYFSEQEHILTDLQEQFIYGSLLGDLNIGKPDNQHPNCRLYIVHSQKQEELFMKKVEMLGEFMGAYKLTNLTPDKRTGKVYATYRGNSKAHPAFNKIRDLLYINDTKTITQKFLDKIHSPIALAYWFMDDGAYIGNLATNSFSEQEVDLLIKWLKNEWNINCTKEINKQSTIQYIIHIKANSRKRFEELIFPYIIPSMNYKLKYLPQLAESVG